MKITEGTGRRVISHWGSFFKRVLLAWIGSPSSSSSPRGPTSLHPIDIRSDKQTCCDPFAVFTFSEIWDQLLQMIKVGINRRGGGGICLIQVSGKTRKSAFVFLFSSFGVWWFKMSVNVLFFCFVSNSLVGFEQKKS